jgi:hypothetical protein
MTWSYDTSLSTDKDKVRLLIGDTDTTNQYISDEEIVAMLAFNNDDVYETAAQIADSLAGRYSTTSKLEIDDFMIDFGAVAEQFATLAKRIRVSATNASANTIGAWVAGVSVTAMDAVRDDTDRVNSRFEMGQHDDPANDIIDKRDRVES